MTAAAVHAAAVALCRALLADAGLTVEDLRQRSARRAKAASKAAAAPAPAPAPAPAAEAPPAAAPAAQPRRTAPLVAPAERPMDRAQRLAGPFSQRALAVPGVVAKPRPMQGEAIVPEGVKVTVCPAGQDMRYRVDPSQVIEGGFLAEFRARRGQG